jgi:hypothetical protein
MMRSMLEVIIPALDPKSQLAQDQAQILVANLKLLSDQADRTYEYEMVELREFAALLRQLLECAEGGPETRAAQLAVTDVLHRVEPITALPIPRYSALATCARDACAAVDALLAASHTDGAAEFRATVVSAVLAQAASRNLRERVWFRAAGLDADPQSLPGMDDVLPLDRLNQVEHR